MVVGWNPGTRLGHVRRLSLMQEAALCSRAMWQVRSMCTPNRFKAPDNAPLTDGELERNIQMWLLGMQLSTYPS